MRGFGVSVLMLLGLSAYLLTFTGCASECSNCPAVQQGQPCGPDGCRPCTPPDTGATTWERPRSGAFLCAGCQQPMAGQQVSTLWVDEGNAVSLICQRCQREMPMARKRSIYLDWVRQQPHYDQQRLGRQLMQQIGSPGGAAVPASVPYVFTRL